MVARQTHLAARHLRDQVETVLGRSVEWSGLPDTHGFIAEVLGADDAEAARTTEVSGPPILPGRYYPHALQSVASLLDLIRSHAVDYRVVGGLSAWTLDPICSADPDAEVYRVLGWTNTPLLRWALWRRLDSLSPAAAFRLLDKPEIAVLDRSHRDYVVLSDGLRWGGSERIPGVIAAEDVEFWPVAGHAAEDVPDAINRHHPTNGHGGSNPHTATGPVFALDIERYRDRFAGTAVAA